MDVAASAKVIGWVESTVFGGTADPRDKYESPHAGAALVHGTEMRRAAVRTVSPKPGEGRGVVSPLPDPEWTARTGVALPFFAVERWGVDTVGLALRVTEPAALDALCNPCTFTSPHSGRTRTPDGGSFLQVALHADGSWSSHLDYAFVRAYRTGLVLIEGRLVALLARDASADGLAHPSELVAAAASARRLLDVILATSSGTEPAAVRRLDLTVDLRNRGPRADGLALLEGLAAVGLGVYRPKAHPGRHGHLDGVSWAPPGGGVHFRAYDKGRELSKGKHSSKRRDGTSAPHPLSAPAGELLRLERQYVPQSKDRKTAAALANGDLRKLFCGAWSTWLSGGPLVACGENAAERYLNEQRVAGEISTATMWKLLGAVAAERCGLLDDLATTDADAARAIRADLRRAGLAYSRALAPGRRVALDPALTAATAAWPTGS